MTALEVIRQLHHDTTITEEKAVDLINQHTLSVIEKAVGEAVGAEKAFIREGVRVYGEKIITQVKLLIGE